MTNCRRRAAHLQHLVGDPDDLQFGRRFALEFSHLEVGVDCEATALGGIPPEPTTAQQGVTTLIRSDFEIST